MGVFDIVKDFFPKVQPITYCIETKIQIVLKLMDAISSGRMQRDVAHTDIPHAFLTIKQTTIGAGNMIIPRTCAKESRAWAAKRKPTSFPLSPG